MRILKLDIDGVVCDHAAAICAAVNRDYGCASSRDDVATWDHDFGKVTFLEAVERYYPLDEFILDMPVTDGFNTLLDDIGSRYRVSFITTRVHSHEATVEWIHNNFGEFDVEFTRLKSTAELDLLVDDSEKEVFSILDRNKIGILLRQPWNDHKHIHDRLNTHNNAYFVENFAALRGLLLRI